MKQTVLIAIFFVCGNLVFSQDNWELKNETEGFKIYTKTRVGTSLRESKVIGKANISLQAAVAVMQDPDNFSNFMPDCIESKLLASPSDTVLIHYTLNEAPWPVSDRDGAYQFTYSYNKQTKSVIIKIETLADYVLTKEDNVRIKVCDGYWKFTELSENVIEIEYLIFADPGGSIPSWLANSTAEEMPLDTVFGMIGQAKTEKYKTKQVPSVNKWK